MNGALVWTETPRRRTPVMAAYSDRVLFMRDPTRIDPIVELVATLWKKHPDWRLSQLVINAHAVTHEPGDAYFADDDVLERGLRILLGTPHPDGSREALAA